MRNFVRMGRTLVLAAMLVVGAVYVSNGQTRPPELVGRWIGVDVQLNDATKMSLELFNDGTGIWKSHNRHDFDDDESSTWKVVGNRFVFGTTACDYELKGYVFNLDCESDGRVVFVRKENLDEYNKKKAEERKKKAEEDRIKAEELRVKKAEEDRIKAEEERVKKAEERERIKNEKQRIEKISRYFTDSRDGQKYRAVKIGGKPWMAQNLNYKTGNSRCYGGDNSNCEKYGSLYDWNTAKKACPAGWHLPSRKEWSDLVVAAGGDVAAKTLKSTSNRGTDDLGFSALSGGYFHIFHENGFRYVDTAGVWWTATKYYAMGIITADDNSKVDDRNWENGWGLSFSVRCVKDD